MNNPVLLDAGVVTRCRRRVHLDNDPDMADAVKAPPDPAAEQRNADAMAHRRKVGDELARLFGSAYSTALLVSAGLAVAGLLLAVRVARRATADRARRA